MASRGPPTRGPPTRGPRGIARGQAGPQGSGRGVSGRGVLGRGGSEGPPRRPGDGPSPQPPQGAWNRGGLSQPPQGAWNRGGQSQPPQGQAPKPAWGQTQAQQPSRQGGAGHAPSHPAQSGGNGDRQVRQQMSHMGDREGPQGGAQGGASSLGRGSMRGNRHMGEVLIHTKPETVVSKVGTSGKPVKFTANYFRFTTKTDWCLYQYRVDFTPEEDRTNVRRILMRDHKQKLGAYIFDGTVMFISHRLSPTDDKEPVVFTSQRRNDDAIINISCKSVGDVMYGNPQYLQFFNLMFRNFMGALELQMVKRDFFDAKNKIVVEAVNMELWPGYQTSIRQHEHEIMLNVEITHKVMRRDTCLDLLASCTQRGGDFRTLFAKAVVGTVVLTDYNNRTYRIDDVDWSACPSSTFKRGDQDVSYMAYMKEKYNINIRDPKQPMLVSKSKPREVRAGQSDTVYLIPEVCRCTGLTEDIRSNFRVMKELAQYTRITPPNRIKALQSFINRITSTESVREQMNMWQMRIADQPAEVPGRVLDPERIYLGNQSTEVASADWIKGVRTSQYVHTVPLQNWAVVLPNRLNRDGEHFVSELRQSAKGMRFNLPEPYVISMRDDSAASFVQNLNDFFDRQRPQIVLCLVMNNRADRYNAIKKITYIDRGIPSQVVTARVAGKGMSVATKVVLQMACKIGCIPWTVQNPAKGTMVVGFDVCHDSTRKALSYGAMVATTNDTFGSYFSCVSKHEFGQELSNSLAANMIKAVREWAKQNNGTKPTRIIVYRDGVGDGDLEYVHTHEVAMVKKKLAETYGAEVKMAFIIVNKRIKTRYFHNNANPVPGSVVDDVITQPERYDFYLISQYVGQGSVTPTAYNIISDSTGWKPDNFQRLTYKLTHMYFNWPGPVRVPAPCQYAHKLAFLVGQTLHREINSDLETTLYYL